MTSYANTGLAPSITYSYAVSACDAAGNCSGQQSVTASTKTQDGATTTNQTADCLFNWAERTYPALFAPGGAASSTFAPYYFRFYSSTKNYLAVSAADNHIWVLGPITGNAPLAVAPVANFLGTAGCQ